jgi:hypothetical protein
VTKVERLIVGTKSLGQYRNATISHTTAFYTMTVIEPISSDLFTMILGSQHQSRHQPKNCGLYKWNRRRNGFDTPIQRSNRTAARKKNSERTATQHMEGLSALFDPHSPCPITLMLCSYKMPGRSEHVHARSAFWRKQPQPSHPRARCIV